ncbi:MAG TPA: hypothetical protein VKA46_03810 [Gemmataceae bacterium]|nr:hypothetical protein [Gemmataceae bacterium]
MAADPRKRQKKLERRAAKRQDKKHRLVKEQHAGLAERLTAASRYPVLHSWALEDLWTEGIGQVVISRELPDGSVAFGAFLVDRYCLGVKDAFGNVVGRSEYENKLVRDTRSHFAVREVSPATVRKLVEEAVAYAASLGLSPHADYHKVKPIFGTIDPGESTEEFEFGKDGKPYFFAGPHDTPERCRQILAVLAHSRGPDGFHYTIPAFANLDQVLPDALKHGRARLIRPDPQGSLLDVPMDFDNEGT